MKKTPPSLTNNFQPASGFVAAEKRHVFCKNPYDPRRALDVLEAEIKRRTQGGRPLVVLMAEYHAMPTRVALKQCLLGRLLASSSSFAYGMEKSRDLLDKMVAKAFLYPLTGEALRSLSGTDYDGQRLLKAYRVASGSPYAHIADKSLMNFCLAEKISVSANDVAARTIFFPDREAEDCLDGFHPATRDLIACHAPALKGANIEMESSEGIRLRDQGISERALDHMNRAGAQIYVQECGFRHASGLSTLFAKKGVEVMTVYASTPLHPILSESGAASWPWIFIHGLSDDIIVHPAGCPEEMDFLDMVSASTGGEYQVMPVDEVRLGGPAWAEVRALIPAWVKEAEVQMKTRPPSPSCS